jgi:hypothetical protein
MADRERAKCLLESVQSMPITQNYPGSCYDSSVMHQRSASTNFLQHSFRFYPKNLRGRRLIAHADGGGADESSSDSAGDAGH